MRKIFGEYYSPSGQDYEKLLTEALIVVDANVLLQAYKLPKLGREALLETLEKLKDRLWIPYQVGLEFQANRLAVITEVIGKFDSVLKRGTDWLAKIREEVQQLELERRDTDIDDAHLKECLEKAVKELEKIVAKARTDGSLISHEDPIRDRIDAIIGDQIGPPPVSQDALDKLSRDAQARYDSAIPPGFKDGDKGKDSASAGRYARGIRHERKYGDYYLWRQTLDHVKMTQAKVVLFVTSDSKEDWWQVVSGKTLGPLPSLISEMKMEADCPFFWMYNLRMFLDQANEHLQANISPEALKEVKESEEDLVHKELTSAHDWAFHPARLPPRRPKRKSTLGSQTRQDAVEKWYQSRGFSTYAGNDPAELVAVDDDAMRGVRIIEWDPGTHSGVEYETLLEMAKRAAANPETLAPVVDLVIVVPVNAALKALQDEVLQKSLWFIFHDCGASAMYVGALGLLNSFRPLMSFGGGAE
jgi:hypothetical protein